MLSPRLSPWSALVFASAFVLPTSALAQGASPESESAGRSREGYAWGEPAPDSESRPDAAAEHRYGTVFASAGAGGTLRMLAHADVCDPGVPGREGCRFSPAYLQLQAGYLFDSRETFQHGAGLGIG